MEDSFVLFTKISETVSEMTDEEKGKLFQAILDYQTTGEVPEMDKLVRLVFLPIKHDMDYCAQKRTEAQEQKSIAGKKSAEARAAKKAVEESSETEQRSTEANTVQRRSTPLNTAQHNGNVNVNVNVTNKDNNPPYPPLPGGGVRKDPMEERFERFWFAYPKKTGKGDARKSFLKIKPSSALLERMLSALAAASASYQWQRDKGRFIPNPSTWLNQQRWEDEVRPDMGKPDPKQAPQSRFHNLEERPADNIDQEALEQMRARILGK